MSVDGHRTLDTRGSRCPQPIIDLAREIRALEVGETLEVLSDDAAFGLDAKAWCAGTGHDLLSCEQSGRIWTARVRKIDR